MKHVLAATALAFSLAPALAQESGFKQDSHIVDSGDGNKERSQNYEAKRPYILKWQTDSSYKWKGEFTGNTYRSKSTTAGVHVFDADTDKIIASGSSDDNLSGQVRVDRAGRHYIRIYTTGPWTAWREDQTASPAPADTKKPLTDAEKRAEYILSQQAEAAKATTKPIAPAAPAKPSNTPGLPPGMDKATP